MLVKCYLLAIKGQIKINIREKNVYPFLCEDTMNVLEWVLSCLKYRQKRIECIHYDVNTYLYKPSLYEENLLIH